MNSDTIDTKRLKHDIDNLIAECIDLKAVLRTTWTKPVADEQRRHLRVKRDLTKCFVLLAHLRGRQHVTHRPHDVLEGEDWDPAAWNAAVAERMTHEYARTAEAATAEAAR